jgi:hypothetical protein
LCKYKKGASRCIYPYGAQQSLYTINANDPRPKRAVAPWSYNQRPTKKSVQQTETRRKTACLRERSPCPRVVKFADFVWRTRAKLYFALKIHKYLQIERFLRKKMRLSAKNGKFL